MNTPAMTPAQALIAATLTLLAGSAAGAHITDRLLAGLYAAPDATEEPLRVLETGTPLEVLERDGAFTRVRLGDESTGWVQTEYLSDQKPSRVKLLELQAETGEIRRRLADAERALARTQAALAEAQRVSGGGRDGAGKAATGRRPPDGGAAGPGLLESPGVLIYLTLGGSLLVGFGAGYAVYDHRLRRRFGGFRI
jgi:hypothetical protein